MSKHCAALTFTYTGLEPSTDYTVKVVGVDNNGVAEPNGVSFTIHTAAPAATLTDVINKNGAVVGGIVGAIGALFLALIVGFFVYRQQAVSRQRKMLEDYSSQLQMLTLGRSGGLPATFFGNLEEMDAQALKANLTVPKTQMIGDGASQVTDVTSVQLPAFLLLDYTTDVRPDAKLSATGSAGAIYRGMLLEADAIQRNGGEVIAIKEMVEWPTLSDEDNQARFIQELSMMWALSFHPNVAKLIGYTMNPPAVITKLYPTDMFRYLHMQDDKEQLESHLLLHLASGIVAGIAAIHTLKISHRDINSPNILLAEPRAGAVFPDPVIADFGIARALEDNRRFDSVNGYSPRYAAPEVIARIQVKGTGNTLEDDQTSDMYSIGVLLWEVLSRRIPWDGYTNEDIEMHVRNGERVSDLEVDGQDKIVELINNIIVSLVQVAAERRPSAMATNRKFAKFIRELLESQED